ncbi:MAG TPA: hypothetical protein EYQ24_10495 [Bacteroidetes bacterium]|nr:hypothetical protein [Bacteroidota bacterium]
MTVKRTFRTVKMESTGTNDVSGKIDELIDRMRGEGVEPKCVLLNSKAYRDLKKQVEVDELDEYAGLPVIIDPFIDTATDTPLGLPTAAEVTVAPRPEDHWHSR